MMGELSLIIGMICIVMTLCIYIHELKKVDPVKEKWMEFCNFVAAPFTGLTSLCYVVYQTHFEYFSNGVNATYFVD